MRQFIFIFLLAGILINTSSAQNASPVPAVVDVDLKVRIACGLGPTVSETKDVISKPDQITVNEWTDFDITFSLQGLRWETTPAELLDLVYERNQKQPSRLIGILSIYRWNEQKKKFTFVGNKRLFKTAFLHEIKEGDYLVFHAIFD